MGSLWLLLGPYRPLKQFGKAIFRLLFYSLSEMVLDDSCVLGSALKWLMRKGWLTADRKLGVDGPETRAQGSGTCRSKVRCLAHYPVAQTGGRLEKLFAGNFTD